MVSPGTFGRRHAKSCAVFFALALAGACSGSDFRSDNGGQGAATATFAGQGGESDVVGGAPGRPSGSAGGGAEGVGGDTGASGAGGETSRGTGPRQTNQLLWLKADAITSAADGEPVAAWPDSSGRGRDAIQSAESLRPLYVANQQNSLPVVHFSAAVGTFLETSAFRLFETGSSPLTIFVVFRVNDVSAQAFLLQQPQGICDAPNFELGYRTGNQTSAGVGLHRGCNAANVTVDEIEPFKWYVVVLEVLSSGTSPSNTKIRWNGVDRAVVAEADGWVSAGDYGRVSQPLIIGNRDAVAFHDGYDSPIDGDIAEIIVYSEVDVELRASVEKYLRDKWGLPQ